MLPSVTNEANYMVNALNDTHISSYYKYQKRQTNMEYLRILAMFMIVISHGDTILGYPVLDELHFTIDDFIMRLFKLFGRVGTNCFILLTGYFGVKSVFKLSSLLKLWFVTLFYSVYLLFILKITLNEPLDFSDTITYFFPISFEKYWFVSCYFTLYLFSPFLIKGIKNLTQKQHCCLIIVFLIWWSVFPTLLVYPAYARGTGMNNNMFLWFIFLFIVGSYLSLYVSAKQVNVFKCLMIIIVSVILFFIHIIIAHNTASELWLYMERNNLFTVVISLSLFCLFLKIKPVQNKFINSISVCMIGVYLIHSHPYMWNFIRKYMPVTTDDNLFSLKAFLVMVLIFFICLIIELIRRKISKPFSKYMVDCLQPVDEKIKKIIEKDVASAK